MLAQKADNASVRQQFVTLDSYTLPFIECGTDHLQENRTTSLRNRATSLLALEPLIVITMGPSGPGISILRRYLSAIARIRPLESFLNALGMYFQKSRTVTPLSLAAWDAVKLRSRIMSECAASTAARFFNSSTEREDGRRAR